MALGVQFPFDVIYKDRLHAAKLLSKQLSDYKGRNPLILAIPRGGVVIGAVLAQDILGELDVLLVRKLRCPWSQELAIGAIAEGDMIYLTPLGHNIKKDNPDYVDSEIQYQSKIIAERTTQIRNVKPKADWAGRTVIVTDDGIATGATFMLALEVVKKGNPLELVSAMPVLPFEQVKDIRRRCDRLVYLQAPSDFEAVGQFYESFPTVEMNEVNERLRSCENRRKEKRLC